MLKRLILTFALLVGAFAVSPGTSQAAPLGATAQAEKAAPSNVDKAQFYFVRRRYRPRYRYYRPYYRPYYRRYYRPRYYGFRPRYYRPRYFYRRYW